jgi:hypothetical protein
MNEQIKAALLKNTSLAFSSIIIPDNCRECQSINLDVQYQGGYGGIFTRSHGTLFIGRSHLSEILHFVCLDCGLIQKSYAVKHLKK